MNKYPWWQNALVVLICLLGVLYSLPNLYGEDPALQISGQRMAHVDENGKNSVEAALREAGITPKLSELAGRSIIIRFNSIEDQLKAQAIARKVLGDDYIVALNLAPSTPTWLQKINANPMFLGLDLRGGVHFLIQVDADGAVVSAEERYSNDLRGTLRDAKIHYATLGRLATGGIELKLSNAADMEALKTALRKDYRTLEVDERSATDLVLKIPESEVRDIKRFSVQQNITTLRNRVNELGVAEPVIQQQGLDRIVVQLPGVQDTVQAKKILGATATLEFRMVDSEHSVDDAVAGRVHVGSRLYRERNGKPVLLQKRIIVTGDQITNAMSGIDSTDGGPQVSISLDGQGAKKMLNTTKENVGKPMAVVFIENRTETREVDGKQVETKKRVEEVINIATIREPFGKQFQITGLDSTEEARNLALLLRAGALSAPISIIEERTVGPSLGAENIAKGFNSTLIGFAAIAIFMTGYYLIFGFIASVALFMNMVLLIAVLSLMQATLTLPGMAGIALTVGMAIDSNVLIFERIREELRGGNSPQAAIHAGYERAWATIFDSNITILIAGVALFLLGSGPVRGFAVVLCIGILTSMFSAVVISRAMVNLSFGGRRKLANVPIG